MFLISIETISSIRPSVYYFSLLVFDIYFIGKPADINNDLDKVRTSNTVTNVKHCQYFVQPLSPVVSHRNESFNMNCPSASLLTTVRKYLHTCMCCASSHVYCLRAVLIRGQQLFKGSDYSRQQLFEGSNYSRAATIQRQQLFKGSDYSKAATIQWQQLFEGNDYSMAATIRGQRLFKGSNYSRATTIQRQQLFKGSDYSRAATIHGQHTFEEIWHI